MAPPGSWTDGAVDGALMTAPAESVTTTPIQIPIGGREEGFMRVQDIMSRDIISISPDTEAAAAREAFASRGIGHLVVMKDKVVMGILSERDLARTPDDTPASAIMTRNVVTIEPSATVRKAAGMMRGRAIGCLPVIDKSRLVGIVTTSDLLTAIAKGEIHAAPPKERIVLRKRNPMKRPGRDNQR